MRGLIYSLLSFCKSPPERILNLSHLDVGFVRSRMLLSARNEKNEVRLLIDIHILLERKTW